MKAHQTPLHRAPFSKAAFSLVEVIITIAVVGVISSIAYTAIGKTYDAATATKLDTDVARINSSIDIYLSSGGSLDGITDPQLIVDKLKTTRSRESATKYAGAPASSMIDRRTEAVPLLATDDKPGTRRAIWNISKLRFDVATIGRGGVKEFRLNEEWVDRNIVTEDRDSSTLDFNSGDGWIWKDKKWVAHRGNLAASAIATNPLEFGTPSPTDADDPDDTTGDDEEDDDSGSQPNDDPPLPRLPRPNFDPAPGTYDLSAFPMTVTVTNPPSPSDGHVIVRVGSGSWTTYTGSITVPENTTIRAIAIAADPNQYRDSSTRYGHYRALVDSFSGTSEGGWENPHGGPNMTADIVNASDTSRFAHGDTQIDLGGEILDAGVENTIRFEQATFAEAAPGQRFEIGNLIMHNGTTFNDSEADGVDLDIALDLGSYGTINFSIPFRLENTENSDDRTASADIVELLSLNTGASVTVANLRYDLVLEIESSDANGEVQGTSFLIYEGATANGKIYGKLNPR